MAIVFFRCYARVYGRVYHGHFISDAMPGSTAGSTMAILFLHLLHIVERYGAPKGTW